MMSNSDFMCPVFSKSLVNNSEDRGRDITEYNEAERERERERERYYKIQNKTSFIVGQFKKKTFENQDLELQFSLNLSKTLGEMTNFGIQKDVY